MDIGIWIFLFERVVFKVVDCVWYFRRNIKRDLYEGRLRGVKLE